MPTSNTACCRECGAHWELPGDPPCGHSQVRPDSPLGSFLASFKRELSAVPAPPAGEPESLRVQHARKQGAADGFQQGWHAALQRMREGDKIHYLAELVPSPSAPAGETQKNCQQLGHLFGPDKTCMFCGSPRYCTCSANGIENPSAHNRDCRMSAPAGETARDLEQAGITRNGVRAPKCADCGGPCVWIADAWTTCPSCVTRSREEIMRVLKVGNHTRALERIEELAGETARERLAAIEQIQNVCEGIEWNGPMDSFYEHAVKATSQYDQQYRQMAAEILASRKALRAALAVLRAAEGGK